MTSFFCVQTQKVTLNYQVDSVSYSPHSFDLTVMVINARVRLLEETDKYRPKITNTKDVSYSFN